MSFYEAIMLSIAFAMLLMKLIDYLLNHNDKNN